MPRPPNSERSEGEISVWVLDQQQSAREEIRDLLCDAGYSVRLIDHPNALFYDCTPSYPDCLIIDYALAEFAQALYSKVPLPVILLSHEFSLTTVVQAIRNGGFEFLLKPLDPERLLVSVRCALNDAQHRKLTISRAWQLRGRYRQLTKREKEVFPYVVDGLLNKQTAYELGISEITVRIHRGQIMKKLGAASLADLVKYAARLGIVEI